jgi:DNA mismatch repair protein MutS2
MQSVDKSSEKFPIGAWVQITTIKQTGVVIGYHGARDLIVLVGQTKIRVASDLATILAKKKNSRKNQKPIKRASRYNHELMTIDLHGLSSNEALDRLTNIFNQAIIAGYRGLEVIHGLGSGKLKQVLLDYCTQSEVVASTQASPNNLGVTFVYFF